MNLLLKCDHCELRVTQMGPLRTTGEARKGVLRAAHPDTPFLGQFPPPPGPRTRSKNTATSQNPVVHRFFYFSNASERSFLEDLVTIHGQVLNKKKIITITGIFSIP